MTRKRTAEDPQNHVDNMVPLAELHKAGCEVLEMYGRLSLFWFNRIADDVEPNKELFEGKIDTKDYTQIKLVAGTISPQLILFTNELDKAAAKGTAALEKAVGDLKGSMQAAAMLRDIARINNWTPKFETPHFTGTYNTPFQVMRYIASLLNLKDIHQVRPYDVRVVMQLACEALWKEAPIYTLAAQEMPLEIRIVYGMCHNLEDHGYPISFPALRREAETYVQEHWKLKPHSPQLNWDRFKQDLKKNRVPEDILQ